MDDERTSELEGEQPQEEVSALHPSLHPHRMQELLAQVPRLAFLVVGFLASLPTSSPDGMRGPHNG
jgi:hypothetical protein